MSTEDQLRAWLQGDLSRRLEVTSHVNGFRVTYVEQYTQLTSGTGSSIMNAAASVMPYLKGSSFKRLQADQERLKDDLMRAKEMMSRARARLDDVEKKMRVLQNEVLAGKEAP
jgi:outer membrane murein-binding lipoprotein Lpp